MPHTLLYRPTLIDDVITNNRIDSYLTTFSPANDIELVGAYLWNAHVVSAIYPLISSAEVTLRNAIDRSISQRWGHFWWSHRSLRYLSYRAPTRAPRGPRPPRPRLPYAVRCLQENFDKAARVAMREKRDRYGITAGGRGHNDTVAKTEFSTWGFVLDQEFMGNNLFWPSRLGSVFKGPWPGSPATTLAHARSLVETVRDYRNRLFHHEPAWKGFGVLTEADALRYLNAKIDKIEELLTLIEPESKRLLERNALLSNARRVCTSGEIRRHQHMIKPHNIKTFNKLRALLGDCGQDNRSLMIKIYRGPHRHFLITPR